MSSFSLTETWKTIARTAARAESRRTKIVCTLGPATTEPETIFELAAAGMDVARLNFSHGSHEEHLARLHAVRAAQERLGRPIAVLGDLCGPKIRVAGLENPVRVAAGDVLVLTEPDQAAAGEIGVTFPGLVAAAQRTNVLQQLALEWAVIPVEVEEPTSIEAGWADIVAEVARRELADAGDYIVLTGRADVPIGGSTHHVSVHRL